MDSSMLRQLWSSIESTQASILLKLDDNSLVQRLTQQLKQQRPLNREQTDIVSDYISSRLLLIRDLAQDRLATNHSG